jgi:ferrous iron transport protein B
MKISLVGQPNVGKSLLFSALTGKTPAVSNYPRTTVEFTSATIKERANGKSQVIDYVDTPGVYALEDDRADAVVTKRLVEQSDVVINVVCGPTLDKDLYLTRELAICAKRMVVALNFADVMKSQGLSIDLDRLRKDLSVPVVVVSAKRHTGIDGLRTAISNAQSPTAFDLDSYASNRVVRSNWTERPLVGALLALFSIALTFYLVIRLGTAAAMSIEPHYMSAVNPRIEAYSFRILPDLFAKMIAGRFGALTMGLELCIVWVLPFLLLYAVILTVLEDTGVLARFMVGLHWLLRGVGLSGSAITPPILACGCNVPGVVATRACRPELRQRCTQFIGFAVPCSAQLGAATATLGVLLFPYITALLLFGFLLTFVASRTRRTEEPEVYELPSYQYPDARNAARKVWGRVKYFMFYATPVFLAVCAVASLLYELGITTRLSMALAPFFGILGIPKEASMGVILAMLRKDAGILFLKESGIHGPQLLLAVFFGSCVTPCLVTGSTFFREFPAKQAAKILGIQFLFASAACLALSLILRAVGAA